MKILNQWLIQGGGGGWGRGGLDRPYPNRLFLYLFDAEILASTGSPIITPHVGLFGIVTKSRNK